MGQGVAQLRHRYIAAAVALFLAVSAFAGIRPAAAAAADGTAEVQTSGRWIVQFDEGTPAAAVDLALGLVGIPPSEVVHRIEQIDAVVVKANAAQRALLLAMDVVRHIDPDVQVELLAVPNDEYLDLQNGLDDIGMPAAWDIYPGAGNFAPNGPMTGAPVAIIDSGIDPGHIDFQPFNTRVPICVSYPPNIVFDPVNCYNGADDTVSHGTHVAGTVAAAADNLAGTAGIAPRSPLHIYKACQGQLCWIADLEVALVEATDAGAEVINMSLGSVAPLTTWRDAVYYAIERDVVVVAASGNAGNASHFYPASFGGVVSVAALESGTDNRAYFSQFNSRVDVAAPGTEILSPVAPEAASGTPNAYAYFSGTSMAAAVATGVAANIRSAHPGWSAGKVRAALMNTAVDIAAPGRDYETGKGRIDAAASLTYDPVDDGDLDDDGFADGWDAAPEDPETYSVVSLTGRAATGGVTVSSNWIDLFGFLEFGLLTIQTGNSVLLAFLTPGQAVGTALHSATLSGKGLVLGGLGLGLGSFTILVEDGPSGGHLRVAVNGGVIADGPSGGRLVVQSG